MSLSERDARVIWHPYTQMKNAQLPVAIVRGEGVYLYDEQGKRYIDAVSSWWVNLHGHAHPYIARKVAEQLNTLEHVIFAGFTHRPAVELAEKLLQILPGNPSRIFYTDNGSTAVEVALKMAIQYWHNQGRQKHTFIAFEQAYHGDTFGSMSISARSAFTAPFDPLLFEVISIPVPQAGREEESLKALEAAIQEHGENIAAFIFEPLVLGTGGMLMYEPSALDALLERCRQHHILSIADEVMTGFGRTGRLFACDHLSQPPDIICLSKGITGGTMALGVTSCTEAVYEAFLSDDKLKTLFHGHSYTANPVACAASLASYDLITSRETGEAISRIHAQHRRFAEKLAACQGVKNIRLQGTILAFDVRQEEGVSYFHPVRDELYAYFLKEGVILRPLGNTLYIMPPYCISDEDLNVIYGLILKKFS
jgi:adenosylmethionine-8-amino-7-oxononanoate aminotransferase